MSEVSPGDSMKITGVRFSSRTTSTVVPLGACSRHHASTRATARSMCPCAFHSGSNAGDLLGIVMYSVRVRTIESAKARSVSARARFASNGLGEVGLATAGV